MSVEANILNEQENIATIPRIKQRNLESPSVFLSSRKSLFQLLFRMVYQHLFNAKSILVEEHGVSINCFILESSYLSKVDKSEIKRDILTGI